MALLRQNVIFGAALLGGAALSQGPELAQQYWQRTGGAIEELSRVIADFDQDAARNGLTRQDALARHAAASDRLFVDRGLSMQRTLDRYATLSSQRQAFADTAPVARPLVLAGSDPTLFEGVWRDFRPAVPLTFEGLAWAAAGFFGTTLLAWLAGRAMRWRPRVRRAA